MSSNRYRSSAVETTLNQSIGGRKLFITVALCLHLAGLSPLPARSGVIITGEGPALGPLEDRITQDKITSDSLSLRDIRLAGLKIFATPLNRYDGYGEGPPDFSNPDHTSPGNRPTLGNNGTMLRVNGLDTQSCLECHNQISVSTVPMTFGVGGAGGINATALFQARFFDVEDAAGNGFAAFDGRAINPPALFGLGGVELLAKEMTIDLQRLKAIARSSPAGSQIGLTSKGVDFGYLISTGSGGVDTSHVQGVDEDLIVRPFGRKGEFSSVRSFDLEATQFHMGIQPVEIVGEYVDADHDGVTNELLPGEISAVEIFLCTMDRPRQEKPDKIALRGFEYFQKIGCAECHRPELQTKSRYLDFSYPEIASDPGRNVFYRVDLGRALPQFDQNESNGIEVDLFSDLKRHNMGPDLAESFSRADDKRNAEFVTAKLWGVADTAPYLHDGRALTLPDAIRFHGGEAESARDQFLALPAVKQSAVIAFLKTLLNPRLPNRDVIPVDK
jgi:Di-haem oxidoreductase, putative peroxidase